MWYGAVGRPSSDEPCSLAPLAHRSRVLSMDVIVSPDSGLGAFRLADAASHHVRTDTNAAPLTGPFCRPEPRR